MARTEAQIAADKKYKQLLAGRPRLPGVTLSDDESALLERMAEKHGGKKAAIIAGLKKLEGQDD